MWCKWRQLGKPAPSYQLRYRMKISPLFDIRWCVKQRGNKKGAITLKSEQLLTHHLWYMTHLRAWSPSVIVLCHVSTDQHVSASSLCVPLKQVATVSPLQPLSCTWSLRIKDGWGLALISHVQQPTPATLQTYNDSCGAHRQCEWSVCGKKFPQAASGMVYTIDGTDQLWKCLKRKKSKCLPASEFKALSLSVSSLPRKQWEHGEKEREWEKGREGRQRRDRLFRSVLLSLPCLLRCVSSPLSLCMSACHNQFLSEVMCCPSLSVRLLKRVGNLQTTPAQLTFSLWQSAISLLAVLLTTPCDLQPNWQNRTNTGRDTIMRFWHDNISTAQIVLIEFKMKKNW